MALFSIFIALLGKSPAQLYELMWRGGFGSWFSVQNTLSRAAPLLLAALCVALPARLGLVVIGGEGAIVLGGVAAAATAVAVAGAPSFVGIVLMAHCRHGRRRHLDRRGRRAAPLPRCQRDDLQPADGLYRDRADEPSGRRPAARPGLAQQAVDPPDRSSLRDRRDARHGGPLGARRRRRRLRHLVGADREDALGFCRPHRRRQRARRAGAGPGRRPAHRRLHRAGRRLRRVLPG